MVEIIILLVGLILAIFIAFVKTFNLSVSSLSEFELQRLRESGDKAAARELNRRLLEPTLEAAKNLKVMILSVALVAILVTCLPVWLGIIASLVFLVLVEVAAAKGWFARAAVSFQAKFDRQLIAYLKKISKILAFMQPQTKGGEFSLNSIDELKQLIAGDAGVLSNGEKAQLLGALQFDQTKISDVMVQREQITTVGINETVGPLLLDRLHKAGHNIYPVVDKNLDHLKGLLYMSDLVPLDPDLKEVKDALRPNIHYLSADAKLTEVIDESIKTGRQLFLVKNSASKIVGLIILKDVLKILMGKS